MCGISIFKEENRSKIDLTKHRGIQYSEKIVDGWIYGHHRLPIQTLEEDEWTQPVPLTGGFFLFNGEIFNYDKDKFDNDTEYLQDFFCRHREYEDFPKEMAKWDGFWSIVMVSDMGYTVAFTDPLGKKQLYYNEEGEISSEIKGLTRSGIIDPAYISSVRKWGYNMNDRTIYSDVKRILPNNIYLFVHRKKGDYKDRVPMIAEKNYYDWSHNIPKESIKNLLEESVKRRLVSKKYKVSTLFSGGLDSTIILYFLRKFGSDVNIYSIDNGNDGEMVRWMEKKWDLKINYLNPDIPNLNILDRMGIMEINDGPIDLGSVIPQYYLFQDIKDKIVLTGDGADELFSGYRRAYEYDSQGSDVFEELPFYHLIRLDRMSMNFTIECRNPFLGHEVIKKALSIPWKDRIGKKILKKEFFGLIPDEILFRKKEPLKIQAIRDNEKDHRNKTVDEYLTYLKLKF